MSTFFRNIMGISINLIKYLKYILWYYKQTSVTVVKWFYHFLFMVFFCHWNTQKSLLLPQYHTPLPKTQLPSGSDMRSEKHKGLQVAKRNIQGCNYKLLE